MLKQIPRIPYKWHRINCITCTLRAKLSCHPHSQRESRAHLMLACVESSHYYYSFCTRLYTGTPIVAYLCCTELRNAIRMRMSCRRRRWAIGSRESTFYFSWVLLEELLDKVPFRVIFLPHNHSDLPPPTQTT